MDIAEQTVTMSSPEDIALADRMNAGRRRIEEELAKLIVGQRDVVNQVLLTLFVGGNSLIVGAHAMHVHVEDARLFPKKNDCARR